MNRCENVPMPVETISRLKGVLIKVENEYRELLIPVNLLRNDVRFLDEIKVVNVVRTYMGDIQKVEIEDKSITYSIINLDEVTRKEDPEEKLNNLKLIKEKLEAELLEINKQEEAITSTQAR